MANISRFATHNEYPNDSVEGMDLQHLLHPSTNLALHQQQGPVVLESASGVYVRDNHGKQYLEGMAGLGAPRSAMVKRNWPELPMSKWLNSIILSFLQEEPTSLLCC